MSLVNVETGEIVAVECTREEAEQITVRFREAVGRVESAFNVVVTVAIDAYRNRVWVPLDYSSWDDYCAAEVDAAAARIPRELRVQIVGQMSEAGMSTRAIGSAIGVDHTTVIEDRRAGGGNPPPDEEEEAPVVTGIDGKQYPATNAAAEAKRLRAERTAFIKLWAADGVAVAEIAERLGVTHRTVYNLADAAGVDVRKRRSAAALAELIRPRAERGLTSRQIGAELGVSPEGIRFRAREHGIAIPADTAVGPTHRHDSNRIVNEGVTAIEGALMGFDLVAFDQLDTSQLDVWASSLKNSIRSLNRFVKELTRE